MIYMLQIRSKLEQSAVVWHSGLAEKNKRDLERVQKSALKIILKDRYKNYNYNYDRVKLYCGIFSLKLNLPSKIVLKIKQKQKSFLKKLKLNLPSKIIF